MASVLDAGQPALPLAPPQTAKPNYRSFGDTAATRQLIYDNVYNAASNFEPISNKRYTINLSNVNWRGPEKYSYKDQKRAMLTGGTLGRELHGTWSMVDNETGEEVAKKKSRLGVVPYMTNRGTFISRGNEYTMAHQMRLNPGAFTRIKDNGELEAHLNVKGGMGSRVFLDPSTGIFKINMAQANIPLMDVLRAMNVPDSAIRNAWGNDLTAINMNKSDPKAINKLYAKLVRGDDKDEVTRRSRIAEAFAKMELDPEGTKRTLGVAHSNVTPEALLDVTRKLLRVSRKEEDPDDRDHLAFQTLHGPEDVFAERISKAKADVRQALWKASAKGNLDSLPSGAFDKAIQAGLMGTGLGMPLEEINPADLFDQQSRVTRMGEGGIPSMDAVPDEARAVQPSQFGFVDFLRTPESGKVGVDLRIAAGARKGKDGKFYREVINNKGKKVWKTPADLADAVVAFPGELDRNNPMVATMTKGQVRMMPRDKVEFQMPDMESTFSPLGNLIPMKSMSKGQRVVMGARMITQALPVLNPEAPLVQGGMPDDKNKSFEEHYGQHMGAYRSSGGGRVIDVNPDGIVIQNPDGNKEEIELYNNLPFNRKTFLHNTPTVNVGDEIMPGQLVARSNFTDKEGVTALGKNARVAYIPWEGLNFEDAIVISESFAKKMSSEHMYQHAHEWTKESKKGKKSFISLFPSEYDKKTLANFSDNGYIKPGTEVNFGDPLVLAARERPRTRKAVHQGRKPAYINETIKWEHHSPGIVTDVEHTDKGVSVVVKAASPMEVGDKLSGRYGDKGVISRIVPDSQLPTGADGKPYEVLLNPLGIISRTNPSQIVETALGKIAAKTGQPYKLQDFKDMDDAVEYAIGELRKHGMQDLEDLVDQKTGRKVKDVLTGNRWFMKLHHTAESKAQGRGLGAYTAEGTPAKGGETGAKRVGMLELNSLVSHGATEVARDASMVRGQSAPEYWAQFMSGYKPATPKVPFVYDKFVNQLKASGINVVREGTRTHIMAMRDSDIDKLAGTREIQNTETVDWKEGLKPKRGGLFDEALTGGHNGTKWSYIKLHEPMPNPVMEEPIRRVLGITKNRMEDIISGKETYNGATGPKALKLALENLDLDKAIKQTRADIRSGKKTTRDAAVRKLGYLRDAKRLGISPSEWMISKAPVLPPAFRPVSTMGNKKLPLVADPNFLYKELFDANRSLKDMADELGDDVGEERLAAYHALKGVVGLGDPIHPKNRERKVKGILKHVFGSSPKLGVVQRRLLGSSVDMVGRSVITPNPDLDMDQVGIPEDKAWEIYKPLIVRNLVRKGSSRLQASRAVKERSKVARETLLKEMETRPVIINRAPTLHRYGMMASWPKLVKGDTLQISPLVVGGFGADFDGDAMNYHVPSTDEAAQEAIEKMLPSRNLFSTANFKAHQTPTQEYIGGLYEASARVNERDKPRVFATKADAIKAYMRGDIGVDRKIEILKD
jgi:DNA-directed RNA polymerase beta subunit